MSAGFDEEYFRTLYGEVPRQTRWDRARDDLVVRIVQTYGAGQGTLLDIGCGYGYLLDRFRGRFDIYGVEVSEHAAEQARHRLDDVRIVRADVQRTLPFRRRFHVVLAINIIEHLADPAAAVENIWRVLVPHGLCVVHLPTINGPASRAIYRLAYAKDPTHIYRPSGDDVRSLFESAGFHTLEDSYAPHNRWLLSHRGWHPAYLAAFAMDPYRKSERPSRRRLRPPPVIGGVQRSQRRPIRGMNRRRWPRS